MLCYRAIIVVTSEKVAKKMLIIENSLIDIILQS